MLRHRQLGPTKGTKRSSRPCDNSPHRLRHGEKEREEKTNKQTLFSSEESEIAAYIRTPHADIKSMGSSCYSRLTLKPSEGPARINQDQDQDQFTAEAGERQPHDQRELNELQSHLLRELAGLVGQERAERLYRNHVCRKHFLLVYGEGEKEKELVNKLKRCLRNKGEEVEDQWSISYGQNIQDGWHRLSSNAKAVVVLVSPTLLKNRQLCRYLSEIRHSHQDTTMPLFLEPLTPRSLPSSLAFLQQENAREVSQNHWNPDPFITFLLYQCRRRKHFCTKIKALNALVSELQDNPDYVCPCGTC